jgi:hypothetical protein
MLPQTAVLYSGGHKILQRQTNFNTKKSKQFDLISKAIENMIKAYYTLKLGSFCCFYWAMGVWSADRLSRPKFLKRLQKPHDKVS